MKTNILLSSRGIITIIIFTLLVANISISSADSVPPLPNTFSGTIKFVNSSGQFNAPVGTLIEAYIGNVLKGNTTIITAGRYSIDVIGTNDDDGEDIIFKVVNVISEQKAVFNINISPPQTLDLIINLAEQVTPTPTPTTPPSGGGGSSSSGGGGGGGTSGESYSNIEVKEKYPLYISKDKVTSYAFTNRSNPISFVNITGNTSAGEITTMVEVLRDTSTLVKSSAPGVIYKNVNIWVGTSGFAVPRNIKEATITFMVENSWLDRNNLARNDIRLVKWDGSNWITLETSENMRNDKYTYFEAKTSSFSPFAIIGLKGGIIPTITPGITITVTSTPAVTQPPSEEAPPVNLAIIIGVIFLIAITVIVYIKRKNLIKK